MDSDDPCLTHICCRLSSDDIFQAWRHYTWGSTFFSYSLGPPSGIPINISFSIHLTQKTGTWPGSVVIACAKDQTNIMKKRWKKASSSITTGLSLKSKIIEQAYQCNEGPKWGRHKYNRWYWLRQLRIERINCLWSWLVLAAVFSALICIFDCLIFQIKNISSYR